MDKDFMEFILSIPKIAKELERLNSNLEKSEKEKAERPQAYWRKTVDGGNYEYYTCTHCGHVCYYGLPRSHFCPQCHAYMLGEIE